MVHRRANKLYDEDGDEDNDDDEFYEATEDGYDYEWAHPRIN